MVLTSSPALQHEVEVICVRSVYGLPDDVPAGKTCGIIGYKRDPPSPQVHMGAYNQ